MASDRSIVEYFAEHERYRCGYCGNTDTNYSHGMWAHMLTVQDYQDLIDRGWRRSGKYCYKPSMPITCCPQYTIRCEALNFKLSTSQKKVIKRMNRYLIHGIKSGKTANDLEADESRDDKNQTTIPSEEKQQAGKQCSDAENNNQSEGTLEQTNDIDNIKAAENKIETVEGDVSSLSGKKKDEKKIKSVVGPDPTKPPCKKAKEMRLERRKQKLQQKVESVKDSGVDGNISSEQERPEPSADSKGQGHFMSVHQILQAESDKNKNKPKSLEDLLTEPERAGKCAHKLEIKLVRTHPASKELRYSYEESFEVYRKYQMIIHKEKSHECSKHSYGEFLLSSPLEPKYVEGGIPMGYGSFHQQFILDGKIICVGVIDILPYCVSSKYLYYDPDYDFLSLGTYSALREIAFVRELNKYAKDLKYYYMGFYIYTCPKMRYKGQYFPSFLMCPEVYSWHPVQDCNKILDQKKYSRFAEEGKEDENGKIDVNQVLIVHNGEAMPYEVYKAINPESSDEEEIKEYATFIGRPCAERMLLFRK
ncbi:hypothetical protein CHS0354_016818 [Potamilus streckersoni]|uniref:Arginyl-tRNA--protein transferase 1 n=1 Tax=Potamilus streckersoni TaxID=2493646 RepID=A0AAE0T3V0_9BIVA|nr:hypothetical protein CHS0354_016818 [Potamilus streckersoni]